MKYGTKIKSLLTILDIIFVVNRDKQVMWAELPTDNIYYPFKEYHDGIIFSIRHCDLQC